MTRFDWDRVRREELAKRHGTERLAAEDSEPRPDWNVRDGVRLVQPQKRGVGRTGGTLVRCKTCLQWLRLDRLVSHQRRVHGVKTTTTAAMPVVRKKRR